MKIRLTNALQSTLQSYPLSCKYMHQGIICLFFTTMYISEVNNLTMYVLLFTVYILHIYVYEGGNPRPPWASAIQKQTSAIQNRASLTAIKYTSLRRIYRTRVYAIQNEFLKTLVYVFKTRCLKFFSIIVLLKIIVI